MSTLSRFLAPAALAVGLGFGAMSPALAQSLPQGDLIRVLVEAADVVFRGSTPYYRQGDYGYDDRLVVQRDRYGRPVYYRSVPRNEYYGDSGYGNGNGNGYDYGRNQNDGHRRVKCNKHGKCKVGYYDPRYDRDGRTDQVRYDRNGRYWDGRQWRQGDDRSSSRHRDDDDD